MLMHTTSANGHDTIEFNPEVMDEARAKVDEVFASTAGRMIYAEVGGERTQVKALSEVPAGAELFVVAQLQGG